MSEAVKLVHNFEGNVSRLQKAYASDGEPLDASTLLSKVERVYFSTHVSWTKDYSGNPKTYRPLFMGYKEPTTSTSFVLGHKLSRRGKVKSKKIFRMFEDSDKQVPAEDFLKLLTHSGILDKDAEAFAKEYGDRLMGISSYGQIGLFGSSTYRREKRLELREKLQEESKQNEKFKDWEFERVSDTRLLLYKNKNSENSEIVVVTPQHIVFTKESNHVVDLIVGSSAFPAGLTRVPWCC